MDTLTMDIIDRMKRDMKKMLDEPRRKPQPVILPNVYADTPEGQDWIKRGYAVRHKTIPTSGTR